MPRKKAEPKVEQQPQASGFERLLARSKPKATEAPPTKKTDRPQIIISDEQEESICDDFCVYNEVATLAKTNADHAKSQAHEIVDPKYIKLCIESGGEPDNPKIVTKSSTFMFQAKHVSKFNLPKNPDGSSKLIDECLGDLGFEQTAIDEIKNDVIRTKSFFEIKGLHELQAGTPAEQALCNKLSNLIADNFSVDEQEQLINNYTVATVDTTWKDRAVRIAIRGAEDRAVQEERLTKLFNIIPVSYVFTHAKTVLSAPSSEEMRVAAEKPKETVLTHENYKAVILGNDMTLYFGDKKLGTKKCDNPNHSLASAKKIFREPAELDKLIAKFARE